MQKSLEASLVRIRTANGRVVGAGFLVGEHHILTCAHIVSQALDLADSAVDPPQGVVSLDFPRITPRTLLTARLVLWCPPLPDGSGDIAGLELEREPPTGAEVVRFASAEEVWKHDFSVLGFPAGYDDGVWATGRLLRRQATNWIQIEDVKAQGFAAGPGFSGTPVWDEQLQGVVGMVVAASRLAETRTAFVIPLDVLATAWPLLTVPQGQPRNPYKGLRPFTQRDAVDFFGREAVIEKVVELVNSLVTEQPVSSSTRLLTILGPSGAGKSSLIMAGLLPQLQRGVLPGSDAWLSLDPMVPGKHPLESLVLTLAAHLPERSFSSIREDLEDEAGRGLHQLCMHLLTIHQREQPGARVILLVDQCEELFTQTESEDERQRFIRLLLTACSEPRGPVVVLLTLRADFYDRPMQYPELFRLIESQHLSLLAIEPDNLRRVVEQPAALADVQVTFEGDLVNCLLADVQGQVGALPLLQFTLDQLFQRRSGRQLTLSAYRELGGVKGALTRQAEQTYTALPSEEHRRLARTLFVRLIDPGVTEQDTTRRRAPLSEFALADATQSRLLHETADAFIVARLLTTNEVAGITTLEVSHEALIREWAKLSAWLREARGDIRLQQAISEDAAEWEQRGKPRDRLYRGSQLRESKAWARRDTPSRIEDTFLHASTAYQVRSRVGMTAIALLILLLLVSTGSLVGHLFQPKPSVTNLNDEGAGSLRQAIATSSPGSAITFDSSLRGTIILTSGDLTITKSLSISGPGPGLLSISSGNTGYSIHISPGVSVSISGLTFKETMRGIIRNEGRLTLVNSSVTGNSALQGDNGDGISNYSTGTLTLANSIVSGNRGEGISNEGTLTITNSTISDNKDGGISNFGHGTLTLISSTIAGNTGVYGGGISNSSTLILINSTIADNKASQDGGGIDTEHNQVSIIFCTIYGNTAKLGGGLAIENDRIIRPGQVVIRNSIVAGNRAGSSPDIAGTLTSYGYNLIQNPSGATFAQSRQLLTDIAGTQSTYLAINFELQDNGGSTRTLALRLGSPAIDKIPLQYCQIKDILNNQSGMYTDQRGMKRPDGAEQFCDIGAYESTE